MKHYYFTIYTIILFTRINTPLSAQWRQISGSNAFDGKYKSAILTGKGYKFPYLKPTLVFNLFNENNANFYLDDIGYVGCANNTLTFKFNKEQRFFYSYPSENADSDKLFFTNFGYLDINNEFVQIDELDIIELFKKNQKLSVRFSNDCTTMDFDFALIGSSAALDKVYLNYYKILKKSKAEKLKELEEVERQQIEKDQINKIETQKKNTIDSLKKVEENAKNERILKIDQEITSFNARFSELIEDTKPKFVKGKILTSDSVLFMGRFESNLAFDDLNKFGFVNDEIIEFFNYFINDSIKIHRKDKIYLVHRFENPFGPAHKAHDLYQQMKNRWSTYEKDYLKEKNKEFQNLKFQEFQKITEHYQNYKPQKNRTDFNIEITQLFLETNYDFNFYITSNDLKPQKKTFTKNTNIKILNDYKSFKFRMEYNGQIGYLDFFEVSKVIDIEYLRPFLNFWYNHYK